MGQLDQAQILNSSMEKKAKQFDRIVGEWKQKVDSIGMDLDNAQKETRNASSELFRVKSAYEESVLQLDEGRRENTTLSNEIKDIMDQISEGGRSIHEIDKICKRLEAEKMELEAALSEAEGALEQEENKVLRAQLELAQVRQEIERRIAEKDEEFAILLSNTAFNLLSNLRQFKLRSQDLVFLLLKCSLSLLKSGLELHFLGLQTLPDFVNPMDGATTFADLVHDVLDLIAQDLVLLADLVQLKNRFLIGRLDSEELRGCISAFLLCGVKIH